MKLHTLLLAVFFFFKTIASLTAQCPPIAEFTYSVAPDGYTVIFEAEACDPNIIYAWSFGDGASSTVEDPTHIYSDEGTYIVTMTVSLPAPCTASYTQTATIIINPSSPGSMWLNLTGPTLAGECQQVFFNAQVTGGVPPYTYVWEMGDAYCPAGCPTGNPGPPSFNGVANQAATFKSTAPSTNTVCVTVYDANGDHERKCLEIKVQDFIYPPEIVINGTKNGSCYIPNSNIVFLPDIDPLTAFEYPTNYLWDFGDGTSYLDNIDGGGVAIHTYAMPPNGNITYTVKLTVSDPNGSMQATKTITVCGSGGGSSDWVLSNGSGENTLAMYYPGQGNPISANISFQNNSGITCFGQNVRWKWQFMDEATSPVVVLNTMPGVSNPVLFKKCNSNVDLPQHEYGSNYILDLQDNSCGLMATGNNRKHWGCLSVQANAYETTSGNPPNNTGNVCKTKTNNCLVYIVPDDLLLNDIKVEGDCQTYDLTAQVEGGGWKMVNGVPKYKNYTWTAYDINNPDQEINVLTAPPGNPADKKRINLNDPYFKQFGPDQYIEFMVKLIVEDYANNIVETNQLISFNPFRLHLKDTYARCAGVTSQFSDKPLASGGSGGPYVFTWSGGLSGENPTFTAPLNGSATYSVTVSDGTCTLTKTITVNVTPLNFTWSFSPWPICGITGREIGLYEGYQNDVPLGGSGNYSFEWSTANPNHLAYLSDIHSQHPYASGIPVGQTITYTLTITDIMGGCTASDDFVINSIANAHTAFFDPTSINLCYGEETVLIPKVSPIDNTPPFGNLFNLYKWSTTNPYHDLSGVPTYTTQLPIDKIVASHPSPTNSPFVYTLRYENIVSGCAAEAKINVTIQNPWKHVGYNSVIKSVVNGTTAKLWEQGTINKITEGISNLNNIDIKWWPHAPTTVVLNSGTQLPSNGTFIPTVAAPYLIMTVTDKATGCSQSFKTIRYLILGATPELWVTPSNRFTCINGKVCFDIVFDAQLANYQTTLLPESITLSCGLHAFQNIPQQPHDKSYSITLNLVNSSGLYKGSFCEEEFFQNSTLGFAKPYRLDFGSILPDIWPGISSPAIEIIVGFLPGLANDDTKCLPMNINSGVEGSFKFKFGLECANIGSIHSSSSRSMARDFIEIYPAGEIELLPSTSAGINFGALLAINPCITQEPVPEPGEPPIVAITTDREADIKLATINQEAILEVFPNPFTDEINIRYFIPEDCAGEIAINLLDVTGKVIKEVQHLDYSPSGEHQITYNGGFLTPGIYFYELLSCKHRRAIQKSVKVSNH